MVRWSQLHVAFRLARWNYAKHAVVPAIEHHPAGRIWPVLVTTTRCFSNGGRYSPLPAIFTTTSTSTIGNDRVWSCCWIRNKLSQSSSVSYFSSVRGGEEGDGDETDETATDYNYLHDGTRKLAVGSVHWATVVGVVDFGAFVRVDGSNVEGLVHLRELSSNGRVEWGAAHTVCVVGDRVRVKVLPYRGDKLALSIREAGNDAKRHDQGEGTHTGSQDEKDDTEGKHQPLTMDDLEVGQDYWGTVRSVKTIGAFVRIHGCSFDGLVHISEMSKNYVLDAKSLLSVGDVRKVQVMEKPFPEDDSSEGGRSSGAGSGKLRLSIRRVRPLLREDFQPCTVVIFRLPRDMTEDEVKALCERYGEVLDVDLRPALTEDESKRLTTFVTFNNREDAGKAMKDMRRVSYEVGMNTYHYGVVVKLSHKQDFKERVQELIDKDHEEFLRIADMDPEERRMERRAQREVQRLLAVDPTFDF